MAHRRSLGFARDDKKERVIVRKERLLNRGIFQNWAPDGSVKPSCRTEFVFQFTYRIRDQTLGGAGVAHVGAAYPENYSFGDVGRVVADPLQVAGDHQRVERLRCVVGLLLDQVGKGKEGSVVEFVYAVGPVRESTEVAISASGTSIKPCRAFRTMAEARDAMRGNIHRQINDSETPVDHAPDQRC